LPRKRRVEIAGFYHIFNRGVADESIYLCDDDFLKFLEILQDASQEFSFEIYSFALMPKHYHLLVKMKKPNLSSTLQKINSRYGIYFNNKYNRVGPLWQGRFKSCYVYDDSYLQPLVRYIEFSPIKAHITKNIGEYRWAMSSKNVEFSLLNFELINSVNFDKQLDKQEIEMIDNLNRTNIEINDEFAKKNTRKKLDFYFETSPKEQAIYKAVVDGYTQKEVGNFLGVSHVSISKKTRIYKHKVKLFNKLRDKGVFWSYSKEISYDEAGAELFVEYLLKYGDFDDIALSLELFGKRFIQKVWSKKLKHDKSFIKTNLMIARVFLGMDVESDYFKKAKSGRFEKLKMLAS